jgi:signal transduction histidine kinase
MQEPLKILMLEDSEWDAELIQHEIKKAGISFTSKIVTTRTSYESELSNFAPDVIISDHSLPNFSSIEAFEVYNNCKLNIPFILVTGTVSEEFAVSVLKQGVDDYVLKSNLIRLPPSILHALKTKKTETERRQSQQELLKSENQIRNFATHLNTVLEEERARISREIHDELGQQLIGIKLSIGVCKSQSDFPNELKEKVSSVITDIDATINTLKKIASELRPAILDSYGLMPALEWMCNEFGKKTHINCCFKNITGELKVENNVAITLFRICQETLNNIAKHSGANKVLIEISKLDNNLIMQISDNGKGIDSTKLKNPFSMGIIGMKERAKIIGAKLSIKGDSKSGTSVRLTVAL